MRLSVGFAVLVVLVLMVGPGAGAVGKIIVDPNTAGGRALEKDGIDPRLSQKITYDSGAKRLHAVLEDIAHMSGVKIACGQNSKDWNVRDIPLVVCVKDITLGKLLRAITDATHTKFTSETPEGDSERSYRVYRRWKEKQEIDKLLQAKHDAAIALVRWQWNALAAYGKGKQFTDSRGIEFPKETWLIGKLIATAGPNSDERLLGGDTFRFRGKDPAVHDIMNELYRLKLEKEVSIRNASGQPTTAPKNIDADLESAVLEIRLQDSGPSGGTGMPASFGPFKFGDTQTIDFVDHEMSAIGLLAEYDSEGSLGDKSIKLPPRPKDFELPGRGYNMDNPTMIGLSKEKDWRRAPLNIGIDLEKPKDANDLVFADLIRAVASAAGCNIVVEDFASRMNPRRQQIEQLYKKRTSIAEIFPGMYVDWRVGYSWFFNADANLIVGWADSPAFGWRENHANLVPEQYLNSLKAKLGGAGVEFDDAIHLLALPERARALWIDDARGLECLSQACSCSDASLWRLYDSLQPMDKALAKSENGLPLAKFDTSWLADYIRGARTGQPQSNTIYCSEKDRQKAEEEAALKERALSEPEIISSMVMHVRGLPAGYRSVKTGTNTFTGKAVPVELGLLQYDMVIDYKMDGEWRKMSVQYSPGVMFPIRTEEREAEIIRTVKEKAAAE